MRIACVSAKLIPDAGDVDQDLAVAGLGVGQLDELQLLGPAEFLDLNSLHRLNITATPPDSLTHVPDSRRLNRVRFRAHALRRARADAGRLRRPFLARRELLHRGPGGRARSATTSATSSSRCSRAAASITDDIERVEGGETFFWQGHYDYDMNVAHTDDTQLNVFAEFDPKLSDGLAQRRDAVPGQHPARPAAPRARRVHGRRASPRSTR